MLVGVALSHFMHWCSVVLLWGLARRCFDSAGVKDEGKRATAAFVAAALHIVSPGGVFLSAPYAESFFSGLSMLGYYLYVSAREDSVGFTSGAGLKLMLSGVVFGCATIVRSNGVLNGIPFLLDAVSHSWMVLNPRTAKAAWVTTITNLVCTVVAGSSIAVGIFAPQFMAYRDYCMGREVVRPWCNSIPPSIFTWVQSHYW